MAEAHDDIPDDGRLDTSFHARAAAAGEVESVAWLVERFTPLLLAQAERRMGSALRRHYDPEDVVGDVWSITMPRIGGLDMSEQRHASVFVKFLGTTLLRRIRDLARRHWEDPLAVGGRECDLAANVAGIVTDVARRESRGLVRECLDELDEADRDVIIFRGIEQRSHREIAALMRVEEGAVAVRYHRALKKLRRRLPRSVFEDLPDADMP